MKMSASHRREDDRVLGIESVPNLGFEPGSTAFWRITSGPRFSVCWIGNRIRRPSLALGIFTVTTTGV